MMSTSLTQQLYKILNKSIAPDRRRQLAQIHPYSRLYSDSAKRTHPSADRNSQPIAEALLQQLSLVSPRSDLQLLEIASGSGQHAGFLAPHFPHITFQPTEHDQEHFPSIAAYASTCATGNIRQPLLLDISQDSISLSANTYDYMLNCNMMHISPWECSLGLFRAAGKVLKPGGKLFTYGPYALHGVLQPESNISFDQSLRSRNKEWGVRDIDDLEKLATNNGLRLQHTQEMPSNNKFLTWIKQQ